METPFEKPLIERGKPPQPELTPRQIYEEDEILQNAAPIMLKYFTVQSTKLWQKKEDYPQKNLVVCTKKPKEFAADALNVSMEDLVK